MPNFLGSFPGCVEAGEAVEVHHFISETASLICQYVLNETPSRLEVKKNASGPNLLQGTFREIIINIKPILSGTEPLSIV